MTFETQAIFDQIPLLYECCKPVRGSSRGAIFDLQRQKYIFVPNDLIDIVASNTPKTVKSVINDLSDSDSETYVDYLNYLFEKEFIHFVHGEELSMFPQLKMGFESSCTISNAIIDIDKNSTHNFRKIAYELDELGCEGLEIRIYFSINRLKLIQILDYFESTSIKSIVLKITYSDQIDNDDFYNLLSVNYLRVFCLEMYAEDIIESNTRYKNFFLLKRSFDLTSAHHCGGVSEDYFVLNMKTFTEATHANSCLNKKISIDSRGFVKNCPSLLNNFGHHEEIKLSEVANMLKFQEVWSVNKDLVNECNVCEFRYICIDCRAFLSNPSDAFSKPLKCGYDPYTGKWSDWTRNKINQGAMRHYGFTEI